MKTFSFDQLATAYAVDITPELREAVQTGSQIIFPDYDGVNFNIECVVASEGMKYVEVVPDQDTGHERYVLEVDGYNNIMRGYALENDVYSLLFTA